MRLEDALLRDVLSFRWAPHAGLTPDRHVAVDKSSQRSLTATARTNSSPTSDRQQHGKLRRVVRIA